MVQHNYNLDAAEKEVLGEYEIITDLQFLIDQNAEVLAFDTETLGLRPFDRDCKLLTLQFTTEAGKGYLVSWDHQTHQRVCAVS